MQVLQMGASVGGAVAPYIISPFLSDIPPELTNNQTVLNFTVLSDTVLKPIASDDIVNVLSSARDNSNSSAFSDSIDIDVVDMYRNNIEMVRYAYVLIGVLSLVSGVLFLILFFVNGITWTKIEEIPGKEATQHAQQSTSAERSSRFYVLLFVCFSLFFVLYPYAENVPSAFVSVFLVNYLHLPVQSGAVAVSAFWMSLTASRIINIPFSFCLAPTTIVAFHLLVILTSYLCMLVFVHDGGKAVVLGCLIAAGFGLGPLFAAQMVWASRLLPFTGKLASLLSTSWAVGKISALMVSGYIMEEYGDMCMVYIMVAGSAAMTAIFFLMLAVSKLCRRHTSSKADETGNETNGDDDARMSLA